MENNIHNIYTHDKISRYLNDQLSPSERTTLEQAALENPMILMAIKGYAQDKNVDHSSTLLDIRKKISASKKSTNQFSWLKYAASIALIAGLFYGVWNNQFTSSEHQVAVQETNTSEVQEDILSVAAEPSNQQSTGGLKNILSIPESNNTKKEKKDIPSPPQPIINKEQPSLNSETSVTQENINKAKPAVQDDQVNIETTKPAYAVEAEVKDTEHSIIAEKTAVNFDNNATANIPNVASTKDEILRKEMPKEIRVIIKGEIVDESGQPILGAKVSYLDSDMGTSSDVNGQFTIDKLKNESIEISYIGYHPIVKEISDINNDPFKITMEPSSVALQEIMVTNRDHSTDKKRKSQTAQRPLFVEVQLNNSLEEILYRSDIHKMENDIAVIVRQSDPKPQRVIYTFEILTSGLIQNIKMDISEDPVFHQELRDYLSQFEFDLKQTTLSLNKCELLIEIE